ncbi:unnamed protein product [Bursaphelenchus xylophilus]|uniref:Farnesyl pyrophosphate synthase n=1 Tax=Bursaphelenchus xylophilus TaxID=6326 RepID=A0A1I7RNT8_BURXY|nr:unnamed protein product [Bursaphelenchus xylophilus]CAG9124285.1 unnamed protein product [Bursaphelenchus xylophilus]
MSRQFVRTVIKGLKGEVGDLMSHTLKGRERQMFQTRLENCFEYNMGDGKCARSALGLDIYKALCPTATQEDQLNAAKVCITNELLQTFLLVTDDIMDHAVTRRGKPCWYMLDGIGLTAINDGLLLDSAIDLLIRTVIPNHPKRDIILRDVYETKRVTIIGQTLDSLMSGIDGCTWDRYQQVVNHKTSHYTYLLPLQLGFHLADRADYKPLVPFTFKLGYFFQAQDDYLDIFGDNSVTGKTPTDIAEGKCTWISCKALDLMRNPKNPREDLLKEFKEHFNKEDDRSVARVSDIFNELQLDKEFKAFEEKEVQELHNIINSIEPEELRPVYTESLNSLTGRKF